MRHVRLSVRMLKFKGVAIVRTLRLRIRKSQRSWRELLKLVQSIAMK
jgi:hypothetical protein